MKIPEDKVETRIGEYVRGGVDSAPSADIAYLTDMYKQTVAQRFIPLPPTDLVAWKEGNATWHIGEQLYCSIKVDGQYALLYYDRDEKEGKSCFVSHSTHRTFMCLQVNKDLEEIFTKRPEKVIILAGELYAAPGQPPDFEARARIYEFNHYTKNPETPKDLDRIGFRVYDIIQLDGENWLEKPYSERFAKIQEMIPKTDRVAPVVTKVLKSAELADFYANAVRKGHEGIVIRNPETFKGYKVKPIHTFDAVIIGAVEGIEGTKVGSGMLASALVAVRNPGGDYIILSKVGGGISDQQRQDLWKEMHFANQPNFVAATTDGRSFRMVKPEIVVEVEYLDIITHTSQGEEILQTALSFNPDSNTWDILRPTPFVSLNSPRFSEAHAIRDDKTPSIEDIRISQVTDFVDVTPKVSIPKPILPHSTILARYVFAKGADMVRKYMAWQTNKHEQDPTFPAYVVYSLDYSAFRADPLTRTVISTDDLSQMWEIFAQQVRGGIIGATGGIIRGWAIYDQYDSRGMKMDFEVAGTKIPEVHPKKRGKSRTKTIPLGVG